MVYNCALQVWDTDAALRLSPTVPLKNLETDFKCASPEKGPEESDADTMPAKVPKVGMILLV